VLKGNEKRLNLPLAGESGSEGKVKALNLPFAWESCVRR